MGYLDGALWRSILTSESISGRLRASEFLHVNALNTLTLENYLRIYYINLHSQYVHCYGRDAHQQNMYTCLNRVLKSARCTRTVCRNHEQDVIDVFLKTKAFRFICAFHALSFTPPSLSRQTS